MNIRIATIEAALQTEDIEGFIALGAPGDEYRNEAEEISKSLASFPDEQVTEANIIAVIALVWAKSFNRSKDEIQLRLPAFQRVAAILLKAKQ